MRAGLVIYHPREQAVLLIRDTRTNKWSFPKGRAQKCDVDMVDTAVRQTYEETGFVLDKHYRLLTHKFEMYEWVNKVGMYNFANILHAEAKTADLPFVSCEVQHVAEVAWVQIRDIPSINGNVYLHDWVRRYY